MTKINLKFLILFSVLSFLLLFNSSLAADPIIGGLKNTGYHAGYPISESTGKPNKEIAAALGSYINGLLLLIGLLFMILIIYGGYLWMMAQGNEDQIKRAKLVIISATLGLLVILVARIATEFIIREFGGAAGL